MNGSSRRRSPLRAILAAVLLGAVLAGSASLATRLSGPHQVLADPSAGSALVALTADPTGLTPTGTGVAGTTSTSAGTTTPSSTTSTTTVTPPTTTPPTTTPPTTSRTPKLTGSQVSQVVALVNQARAQAGCPALREDSRLDRAAQQHSTDMAQRHYFSHTTPEGVPFDQRERQAGYVSSAGGENIAQGQTSAQQVMTAWMNSSGHRANILNCHYAAIGVGLDTDGWYWTQDFGSS